MPVRDYLDWWLIERTWPTVGGTIPRQVNLGCIRKAAGHEPVSSILTSSASGFYLISFPSFSWWWIMSWKCKPNKPYLPLNCFLFKVFYHNKRKANSTTRPKEPMQWTPSQVPFHCPNTGVSHSPIFDHLPHLLETFTHSKQRDQLTKVRPQETAGPHIWVPREETAGPHKRYPRRNISNHTSCLSSTQPWGPKDLSYNLNQSSSKCFSPDTLAPFFSFGQI